MWLTKPASHNLPHTLTICFLHLIPFESVVKVPQIKSADWNLGLPENENQIEMKQVKKCITAEETCTC